jgi:GAF domain-containing protein
MKVVGQQIGVAIENAKLFEQTQKRAAELATVSKLGTTITTILDIQEMLDKVVDQAKLQFDMYHVQIYMIDQDGINLVLTAGAGDIGRQLVEEGLQIKVDTETSLVAKAARQRQGVIVNNVESDPDFMMNPLLPDTASEMAVPLIAGNRVLGVMDIQSDERGYFSEEDIIIQTTLASQVAVAIQNAETYTRTQKQAEQEAMINLISQRIQSTTSVENAMQVAIRELGRALGAKRTNIQLGLNGKNGQND